MDLASLAASAVNNNNAKAAGKTPVYAISVEEARGRVVIGDGNRKANEDGSQALTLRLGKITLSLEAIKPNATCVNATAEQVEDFTSVLQAGVDAGTFDDAIAEAQAKADPANKVAPAPVVEDDEVPEQVDLDDLG